MSRNLKLSTDISKWYVVFYLLLIFELLYFQERWNVIIFLILIFSILVRTVKLRNVFLYWKTVLILIITSSIFYAGFSKHISHLELWGDEIGVINFAEKSFETIVKNVSTYHASVPPLDYWNLFLWVKIFKPFLFFLPVELFYRIPYMIIHTISSVLFFFLLKNTLSKNQKGRFAKHLEILIPISGFLTYFFNPILFFYSIEVRYYALACLGIISSVMLSEKKLLFKPLYVPLHFLFCLNSIFHIVVIFPFFVNDLCIKDKRKETLYSFFSIVVLISLILPKLLFPSATSNSNFLQLVKEAIRVYISNQFFLNYQLVGLIFILYLYLHGHVLNKKFFFFVFLGLFYFFSSIFIGYTKKYFDFNTRHLIYSIPPLIIALYYPVLLLKKNILSLICVCFISLVTVSWFLQTNNILYSKVLFSKALIGAKDIYEMAVSKKNTIILMPNINPNFSQDIYEFYVFTFRWYSHIYPIVQVYYPKTADEACNIFQNSKDSLLYNPGNIISCKNVSLNYSNLFFAGVGEHN